MDALVLLINVTNVTGLKESMNHLVLVILDSMMMEPTKIAKNALLNAKLAVVQLISVQVFSIIFVNKLDYFANLKFIQVAKGIIGLLFCLIVGVNWDFMMMGLIRIAKFALFLVLIVLTLIWEFNVLPV